MWVALMNVDAGQIKISQNLFLKVQFFSMMLLVYCTTIQYGSGRTLRGIVMTCKLQELVIISSEIICPKHNLSTPSEVEIWGLLCMYINGSNTIAGTSSRSALTWRHSLVAHRRAWTRVVVRPTSTRVTVAAPTYCTLYSCTLATTMADTTSCSSTRAAMLGLVNIYSPPPPAGIIYSIVNVV